MMRGGASYQRAPDIAPDSGYEPGPLAFERECDPVTKGGITSGVICSLAAWELAGTYRFRSIGGS